MNARYERDAGLRRLRSANGGIALAGVAAIGLVAAGVAVAAPGHSTASTVPRGGSNQPAAVSGDDGTSGTSGTDSTSVQAPSVGSNAVNQPPVATSAGS